jgi:hypothetical protein
MERLMKHFRCAHQMVISEKTARRLASTVRNMGNVGSFILFGVTGSDAAALLPRRVDASLGELRAALEGRRVVA